jgi:hypothetical protein
MKAALLAKVTDPSCESPRVLAKRMRVNDGQQGRQRKARTERSYREASELVDRVAGIGVVTGQESIGSGDEVGGRRVGEQVEETVDDVGHLPWIQTAVDGSCGEGRGRAAAGGEGAGLRGGCTPAASLHDWRGEGAGGKGHGKQGGREAHVE